MRIKATLERIPGGLMLVPLLLGATLNTIDQAHLPAVEAALRALGASPAKNGHLEFLRLGAVPAEGVSSFTESLFKTGALTLIALFLFCVGSQMTVRVGARALGKGVLLTGSKFVAGAATGMLLGHWLDPFQGFLGLSTLAIVAAMTNGNGGLFAALTGQYGNRSDIGALSVLSLNDGPFLTLVALGLMGERFPTVVFLAVLVPLALGLLAGNLDEELREFLRPGERLIVPFFAFALGAGMNLAVFAQWNLLLGGLLLGLMTTVISGGAMWLALAAGGFRSRLAAMAEASVAGNAAATPAAIAAAAAAAHSPHAAAYQAIVGPATAQISIAVITTALLCPLAVVLLDRRQRARGIEGQREIDDPVPSA
ncbi:MAG TPA: 2-keto-3-deoxygluconate permease [Lacunisphaera sp.]|jgi:2-keto-3-deoxygluconate permease|nr:2-keto-3-deoxygluconate permease [Lacunisphaera sp.]